MTFIPKSLQRFQFARVVALLLLLILLGVGTAPGYFQGHWPWSREPKVTTIKELRSLSKQGLEVVGWKTASRQPVTIGGHKWLLQEIQPSTATTSQTNPSPIALLFFAQQKQNHQPQVEWMDLKGSQQWKMDSVERVQVMVPPDANTGTATAQVAAQFSRAWNERQTFAVLQWYAWPGGGDPSPDRWFWFDQSAQLQNRRLPWIAVSLLIPIEPLGDIKTVWPIAESLAQKVQRGLMAGPLRSTS